MSFANIERNLKIIDNNLNILGTYTVVKLFSEKFKYA